MAEAPEETSSAPDEFKSLKHQLLGPSLTKAGQDTVDQKKVSEIIYNASKGSKFFNNEETRDRVLTVKIQKIIARKEQLLKLDNSHELRRADEYIASLELSRDLSQTIVHVDCDAFYAAVEELDRPELRHVPMAVGKGVLTTCNYHARKFGCRSGMAGFVAMKLCPQLICLPLNFDKYASKAKEVREVLSNYDERFESASMDEAYLNITMYCKEHAMDAEAVVQQLRQEVFDKCKITVSAGIASNAKLAKIGSNKNKPNGQFKLAADRASIMAFMRDLPVRKLNGVGRVFERELDAIGIKKCGELYAQRAILQKLFGEKAFHFLMNCYLGIGRTQVAPAEESERKSVGTESTFHDMEGKSAIREKLRHTAEELEGDLRRTGCKGRTLVLKLKLHTYEVLSRQTVPPHAVSKADDLYRYALPMLARLESEMPRMRLRLLGLRCTNLVSTAKSEVDFFGFQNRSIKSMDEVTSSDGRKVDADGWELWPEAEFEAAAKREKQEDMAETERLSQEQREHEQGVQVTKIHSPGTVGPVRKRPASSKEQFWDCPICHRPQIADEKVLNAHVDLCLSRQTIRDVLKDSTEADEPASGQERETTAVEVGSRKKRGRAKADEKGDVDERKGKRKAFFS